ncbi:MAG TPA: penicillin-binding protein activator [Syntrophales bacterium]|nr:penicillin-binding protein activator [Syntrophales bacterium]
MTERKPVMKIRVFIFTISWVILFSSLCVGSEQAGSDKMEKNGNRFSLGTILPLTGPYERYGVRVLESLILAGGFFDADRDSFWELHIEDSQMRPENARKGLMRLADRENLLAVIGPLSSEEAFPSTEAAQQRGIPLITLTKNEEVTQGGAYCFSGVPSSRNQLSHLSYYMRDELGKSRIAILYPNVPSGRDAAQFFRSEIKKRGGKVTHFVSYQEDATDFSREIAALVGKQKDMGHDGRDTRKMTHRIGFDALFIPDTALRVSQIASQLSFYNVRGFQLLGNSSWHDPDILMKQRDLLNGAIFVDGYISYGNNRETEAFVDHFYTVYGREPDALQAYTYDAMTLILEKILKRDAPISREQLKAELAEVKAYPGVSGSITMTAQRIMDSEPLLIVLMNGERVRINEP